MKKKNITRPTFQTLLLCGECSALTKRRKTKALFFRLYINIKWILFFFSFTSSTVIVTVWNVLMCTHFSLPMSLSLSLYSIWYAVNGRLTENNTTKEDSIYIKWNYVDAVFETCFDRSQQHSTPSSNDTKNTTSSLLLFFIQAEFRNK